MFVALYNPDTLVIAAQEEYNDSKEGYERWTMFEVESRTRGFPWRPYMGDKPFSFEVPNAETPTA